MINFNGIHHPLPISSSVGDKLFSGVLGGCCLVNLTIFDDVHKAILLPEDAVVQGESFKGREGWIGHKTFYEIPFGLLRWKTQLNSPFEKFMGFALQMMYGNYAFTRTELTFEKWTKEWKKEAEGDGPLAEKCQWLKEWEEAALSEGIYTQK